MITFNEPSIPLFYRVDHSNSTSYIESNNLIKLKLELYNALASMEEDILGREMNKLFEKIVPNGNEEVLKLLIILANEYQENPITNDELCNVMTDIINHDYEMEFELSEKNCQDLIKILAYCYREIGKRYTNLKKFEDLTKVMNDLFEKNIDLLTIFREKDYSRSFSQDYSCHGQQYTSRSSFSVPKVKSNNIFRYHLVVNDFDVPIEMIILMNKFQSIKRIKLSLTNEKIKIKLSILLLFNVELLFQNLFDVEFNLSNNSLHESLYRMYQRKMDRLINSVHRRESRMRNRPRRRRNVFNPPSENEDSWSNNYSSLTDTDTSQARAEMTINNYFDYCDLLENKSIVFELVIIYSCFISQWHGLKVVSFIFPDSFQNEIEEYLKLNNISILNFHFLNIVSALSSAIQLRIEFNSLDMNSFEKVLGIIHKNNQLKSLRLSLFTSGAYHYSHSALYKIGSVSRINMKNFLKSSEELIKIFLEYFEENLEKLFLLLQSKDNLNELELNFDLPPIISSNESYVITFLTFLFNIILLLNDVNLFHTISILAPLLAFDTRKYSIISKFLNIIDLRQKNPLLQNLTLHLQFSQVYDIQRLLSYHLQILFIGDLDVDTLKHFIDYYLSDPFLQKSKLACLKLSLSKLILDFSNVKEILLKFFGKNCKGPRNNPRNLKEFYLITSMSICRKDISTIYHLINYNTVERYGFEFNLESQSDANIIDNKLRSCSDNKNLQEVIVKFLTFLSKEHNERFLQPRIVNTILIFCHKNREKAVQINFKS